jgi:tyrosyl-tRNA synthetase
MDKIEEIMSEHNQSKGKKFAQKTLAFEVTKDIRGNDEAVRAEEITAILFEPSKDLTTLSMKDINDIKEDIPFYDNQGEKINVIDLLIAAQIATSKREAREFLSSKTILIDGLNVENETDEVVPVNFEKKYLLIKKGKRSYYLIKY